MVFWIYKKHLPAKFCHNFVSQCLSLVYSSFCYTKVAKKEKKKE